MRMSGRSSRFGIDAEQVPAAILQVRRHAHLDLAGLHAYAGTQCFEAAAFVEHAKALVEAADTWQRELDTPLAELDLGGGFGTELFAGDPEFDLAAAGHGLQNLLAAHDRPGRRWFVELGRYFTAPAGVYLARVVATKTSGDERHVVCDGGLHHCAAPLGLGAVLKRSPVLAHAGRLHGPTVPQTLGGPLCTPLDQFAAQHELPEFAVGDVLAVLQAGAYGLSYSPSGFLSHATPAEVLVENGRARLIRDRGDARDVLRGQRQ
jgi:diaminopimelate decarboxylase